MPASANIKFVDSTGRRVFVYIAQVSSASALSDFIRAVSPYTAAEIQKASWIDTEIVAIPGTGTSPLDVSNYAEVYCRDLDHHTLPCFMIPAPSMHIFEHIEHVGYRVTQAHGHALAELFRSLTGRNLEFSEGKLK